MYARPGGNLGKSNREEQRSVDATAGTASIVDTTSGKILSTVVVGIEPEGVTISPDGRWVYVTAETSNTVSVIDTAKNDVVATFMVGARPKDAAFSPDGSREYVTAELGRTLSVIDTKTHTVVRTIHLPSGDGVKPMGVVVSNGFCLKSRFEAAPPSDVRRGFASPQAGKKEVGLCPRFGLALIFYGANGRTRGLAPSFFNQCPARQSRAAHLAAKPVRKYF
ncbi:MAG TPA: hypothetical protein VFS77_20915 [Pyrinomonadaceae bacterium]|nr:hypothetical protein [Pyrinomonadaceae bacterium]